MGGSGELKSKEGKTDLTDVLPMALHGVFELVLDFIYELPPADDSKDAKANDSAKQVEMQEFAILSFLSSYFRLILFLCSS